MRHLERAAVLRWHYSAFVLGCVHEGLHGATADLPRAAYWHLRGAADGNQDSAARLDALRATPDGQRAIKLASAALAGH
jgi:hypothetical protein